jgi:hypothetical protein
MSHQGKGRDGDTAPALYLRQQVVGAARLSLEVAVRDAFPVVEELPADLAELAGRLNSSQTLTRR